MAALFIVGGVAMAFVGEPVGGLLDTGLGLLVAFSRCSVCGNAGGTRVVSVVIEVMMIGAGLQQLAYSDFGLAPVALGILLIIVLCARSSARARFAQR